MTIKKIIIYGGIFIVATVFFISMLNRVAQRGRAASTPVTIFFEKETVQTQSPATPVNIMFQVEPGKKISGGSVRLLYPAQTLEVDESMAGTMDVSCSSNGGLLKTQAKFENDAASGTVTISNVLLDQADVNLPPQTGSGIFCFGTVYFKFIPVITLEEKPLVATVSFNTDPNTCEIVGPDQEYSCTFPTGAGAKVTISRDAQTVKTPPYFSIASNNVTMKVGETYDFMVDLHTGFNNVGFSDTYVTFDPQLVAIEKISSSQNGFSSLIGSKIDASSFSIHNEITASASSELVPSLAVVTVKAKATGVGDLTVVCNPGQTTDSNIIEKGTVKDIIDCTRNQHAKIVVVDENITPSPTVAGACKTDADCPQIYCITTPCPVNKCTPNGVCVITQPTVSVSPTGGLCPKKAQGDCNCDGLVAIGDFEMWRKEFLKETSTQKCDFNTDTKLNLSDFNIWRTGYFSEAVNF